MGLVFHVPNVTSVDGPPLEVLETILGGGASSRLNHELVYRRRIAHEVGTEYDTLSVDPGLFSVYAQPLPGKAFKVPLARNTIVRTLLDLVEEARP